MIKKLRELDTAFLKAIVIIVLILAIVGGNICIKYTNPQKYVITVNDTQVKRASKYSDKYLIFATTNTEKNIVFENTDLWFKGKFNSSDVQAEIKKGNTYEISTIGHRIPLLSFYENLSE